MSIRTTIRSAALSSQGTGRATCLAPTRSLQRKKCKGRAPRRVKQRGHQIIAQLSLTRNGRRAAIGLAHFALRALLHFAADSFAEAGAATPTRRRGDAGPRAPVEYPWSTPKPLDRLNGLPGCHPRWTVASNAAATRNITRHPRAVVSLPRAGR